VLYDCQDDLKPLPLSLQHFPLCSFIFPTRLLAPCFVSWEHVCVGMDELSIHSRLSHVLGTWVEEGLWMAKTIPVSYSYLKHLNFPILVNIWLGFMVKLYIFPEGHKYKCSQSLPHNLNCLFLCYRSYLWTLTIFSVTSVLSYVNWHLLLFDLICIGVNC
jgi:hypothetical protein